MAPRPDKKPTEWWYTSQLHHNRTGRPGFIHALRRVDDITLQPFTTWLAVVPEEKPRVWASREEAHNYVVWWRCTNGYDENGVKL